jgi:hypothetical protein
MKYLSVILLLMAVLIIAVLVAALILIGIVNLNQNTVSPETITISPTSAPEPEPTFTTIETTPSNQDPIIGSWLNGMVFYANGTVGSDGTTTWEINKNENNSYFIKSDMLSPGANNPRSVSSAEWIYNPASDKINKRGSPETVARGKPTPVPTTKPTITTIQTQLTQRINTTNLSGSGQGIPGKFSYSDCLSACKIAFSVDHNNGIFNDCIQTCNIENLKVSN